MGSVNPRVWYYLSCFLTCSLSCTVQLPRLPYGCCVILPLSGIPACTCNQHVFSKLCQLSLVCLHATRHFSIGCTPYGKLTRDIHSSVIVLPTAWQLFSNALWLLDSCWQYFLFTMFMIASFEAMVVMQRLKNLQTLKGMGNDVVNIRVFRGGR